MSTILLSGSEEERTTDDVDTNVYRSSAIAVLIPLISVVGFPTMNAKPSSHSSSGDICKQNALKYEQLGYYKGGAAQFNAVMATCAVGSS